MAITQSQETTKPMNVSVAQKAQPQFRSIWRSPVFGKVERYRAPEHLRVPFYDYIELDLEPAAKADDPAPTAKTKKRAATKVKPTSASQKIWPTMDKTAPAPVVEAVPAPSSTSDLPPVSVIESATEPVAEMAPEPEIELTPAPSAEPLPQPEGFSMDSAMGTAEIMSQPTQETGLVIEEQLKKLTPRQSGLLMAYVSGMTYTDIGRVSGVARSTATSALSHIRDIFGDSSCEQMRERCKPFLEAIPADDYERRYGIPKEWWTRKDSAVKKIMGPPPNSRNQHIFKRIAAKRLNRKDISG